MQAKISSLENQIKAMQVKAQEGQSSRAHVQVVQEEIGCKSCMSGDHAWEECHDNPESVYFVGNQRNYQQGGQNAYHGNRNNHPGFQWSNSSGAANPFQQRPQGNHFQNSQPHQYDAYAETLAQRALPAPPPKDTRSLEDVLKTFMSMIGEKMKKTDDIVESHGAILESHGAILKNLESNMGIIAQALQHRPQGQLPSTTVDPRAHVKLLQNGDEIKKHESCNAISLRSGKLLSPPFVVVDNDVPPLQKHEIVQEKVHVTPNMDEVLVEEWVEDEVEEIVEKPIEAPKMQEKKRIEDPPRNRPPPPFPSRVAKKSDESEYRKFVDMLSEVKVNIPLLDVIKQCPKYLRFFKDILSKKKKFQEFEMVALTEDVTARCQNKLPPKLKDPGSFNLPVVIGDKFEGKAMCDLGASINLMPKSLFDKLGIGEAKPTSMILQMADRTLASPWGVIEDVLVKVGNLVLPADFVILECDADGKVPLILGRPFLATGRTMIDVHGGVVTLSIEDESETFYVSGKEKARNIKGSSMIKSVASCLGLECMKKKDEHKFGIGDEVVLKAPDPKCKPKNWRPTWIGPLTVIRIVSNKVVEVRDKKTWKVRLVDPEHLSHHWGGYVRTDNT